MAKERNKNIGLDVEPPANSCDSQKCPWHGHLKVRGRIFVGKVVSDKAKTSAVVSWNYYRYIPKYERYERRKTKISVHNPACLNAKTGDSVTIAECRSLSKTKNFVIVEVKR